MATEEKLGEMNNSRIGVTATLLYSNKNVVIFSMMILYYSEMKIF